MVTIFVHKSYFIDIYFNSIEAANYENKFGLTRKTGMCQTDNLDTFFSTNKIDL